MTWPGTYARGRYAAACYAQAGIDGPVAADLEDYARLAVRLGTETDYRHSLREKVAESHDAWFEDEAAATAFAAALERMLA